MTNPEDASPLRDAWEANAIDWIRWARAPGHDSYWRFHRDAFFKIVPAPGEATLDLGCGEGRVARDLAARGHRVTAIDPSATMLAAAREADPQGIYLEARAEALPFADASFDLVIAFMSMQDIDDLDAAVRESARVLRLGGRLAVAIVHPLNSAGAFEKATPGVPFIVRGSYLDESAQVDVVERDGLRMTFHSRHRSMERYSRAFEAAGLVLEALREPPAATTEMSAKAQRWTRVPLFLHLLARRV